MLVIFHNRRRVVRRCQVALIHGDTSTAGAPELPMGGDGNLSMEGTPPPTPTPIPTNHATHLGLPRKKLNINLLQHFALWEWQG